MTEIQIKPSYPKAEEDDDFDHITCHCTESRISFCKLDVSDMPVLLEGMEANPCPTCVLMYELSVPYCPFGCKCDEECRYFVD